MDFDQAAKSLIEAVEGIVSQENIDGVADVLYSIVEQNNLNWEQWILEETNSMLAIDKISCECGNLIKIERTRTLVYADVV